MVEALSNDGCKNTVLPAKEDVSTTRLMESLALATEPSTFLVPFTAGSMSAFCKKHDKPTLWQAAHAFDSLRAA